jgi:membrane fusion protein, copper/silver efflux system
MKRLLWFVLMFAMLTTCSRSKTINGVRQDDSGRRVVAWIDPMYSQGPPHLYKATEPGVAPDCGMKLVPVYADQDSASAAGGVQISAQRQQRIGVKVGAVEIRDLSRTIRTTGRIAVDERRTAQIHTKFEGFVTALYVNFAGQTVRRGDPLLAIFSPDLLATQNELLLAEHDRSELGRTLAAAARARLHLWDMSAADIDRVIGTGKPMRDVIIRSPASGVVLIKNVVAGARVMPADTLYEIADISQVWALADVYESELPYVRTGGSAQVVIGGRTVAGRVTFIGPVLAAQTRTANVRIEVDNAAGLLKPGMYADVVLAQPIGRVVAVADSAVMNTGTRSVVFVARGNGAFEPRQVSTGAKVDGYYEIRSGLTPGERVVIDANFLVDSESRLESALSKMNGGTP